MTTIAGNASALSSLASLYARENEASSGSDAAASSTNGGLTSAQASNLASIAENGSADAPGDLTTLLGQSTTGSSDLSSIIDAIEAEKTAGSSTTNSSSTTDTTGSATASTATVEQQKAAAIMQSVYQTQQANLFTLLG